KADRNIGAEDFGRQLRKEVGQIGGSQMSVFTHTFGGDQKMIQIQLRGGTIKSMTPAAELIADQVRTVKGAVDVGLSTKGQKPELSVDINRGLAGSLGVSVAQVAQSLRPAFAGIKAGDWVDPSDATREVNVRLAPEARLRATAPSEVSVRLAQGARQRAADLEQLPIIVTGPDGRPRTLPLGQIATI